MTNVSRETKPYELISIDDSGHEIRRYENGVLRNEKGHTLALPDGLKSHAITSENAHEFHAMRKAKILRAIEERLIDVTKMSAPADAIAAIVGKRAQIAMTDDSRTGNEAARIVLSAVDAYQDKRDDTKTTVTRHEYSIDADTMHALEVLTRARRDAVDADSSDEYTK